MANTPMDTDKIKIFGTSMKMVVKIAELEVAEKEKMKDMVTTRTRLVSVVAICSNVSGGRPARIIESHRNILATRPGVAKFLREVPMEGHTRLDNMGIKLLGF
ncbi:chaperonin [Culex quinquefasciatus]|uniref:Chaperonin n=1 Tax=Culex quinquefasciatus TaxID=7176 RepID=B0XJU6_CULQU|nr:chaperonin [Culex quinquefasciatus]|eukprot:XP_001869918.1 chaperonin [Culex quinquefasciatus]